MILDAWLNVIGSLTLWLAVPVIAGLLLRHRASEFQRGLGRIALVGIPIVVLAAVLDLGPHRPLLELPAIVSAEPQVELSPLRETRGDEPLVVSGDVDPGDAALATSVESFLPDLAPESGEPLASPRVQTALSHLAETPPPVAPLNATAAVVVGGGALWALLVVLGLVRFGRSLQSLRCVALSWTPVKGPAVAHTRSLGRSLGYTRRFCLFASRILTEAVASGIRRPSIALPASWIPALGREELDPLVLHEIAHLRSRDPLWRALFWLAAILLWPHPLVHWLRRREQVLSEYAADRLVLRAGASRREYARLLGDVAAHQFGLPCSPMAAGILGNRHQLEGRIRMILSSPVPRRSGRTWSSPMLLGLGSTLLLSLIVTHPLVGRCDPCDPPTKPKIAQPLPDLFVANGADELLFAAGQQRAVEGEQFQLAGSPESMQLQRKVAALSEDVSKLEQHIVVAENQLARSEELLKTGLRGKDEVAKLKAEISELHTVLVDRQTELQRLQDHLNSLHQHGNKLHQHGNNQLALDREKHGDIHKALADALRRDDMDLLRHLAQALLARHGDTAARRHDLGFFDRAKAHAAHLAQKAQSAQDANQLHEHHSALMAHLHAQLAHEKRASEESRRQAEARAAAEAALRGDLTLQELHSNHAIHNAHEARKLLERVVEKNGRLGQEDLARVHEFLSSSGTPPTHLRRNSPGHDRQDSLQRMEKMFRELEAMRNEMLELRAVIEQERKTLEETRRHNEKREGKSERLR